MAQLTAETPAVAYAAPAVGPDQRAARAMLLEQLAELLAPLADDAEQLVVLEAARSTAGSPAGVIDAIGRWASPMSLRSPRSASA